MINKIEKDTVVPFCNPHGDQIPKSWLIYLTMTQNIDIVFLQILLNFCNKYIYSILFPFHLISANDKFMNQSNSLRD